MIYKENTTLFNLHTISIEGIKKKIRNSNVDSMNITRIEPFLRIVQMEAMLVNKVDFPIEFTFSITSGNGSEAVIRLSQSVKLLPHLSHLHKDFVFRMNLNDFNRYDQTADVMAFTGFRSYAGRMFENLICPYYTKYTLNFIQKIDSLLNFNNQLIEKVYQQGIYNEIQKINFDNLAIEFDVTTFRLNSYSTIQHCPSDSFESLLSINFMITTQGSKEITDDIKIMFFIYNQKLDLTYKEFMNLDNKDIEKAIIRMVKLKNIVINDMNDLKNEILLNEMLTI